MVKENNYELYLGDCLDEKYFNIAKERIENHKKEE